ncbi:unnamed protein product, partial [Prorocentrum cordatum]
VLLGSDILGPLCFDEDLVGPEEARAMREACCGDWGRPGCWDSFYSPQRCCRGTDDAFRAAARGIRERLVRCLQGEGGQVPEGFFEQATHYAFRPSQKLGRAAWCMARQGEVSSALDLYAGEGGGVELLASGLRGTPGGQVLTFEYAPRETAFFQLLEARLAPYGLRVVAPAELERPGELACGGSAMPVVVVNGAAMPAPEITLGSVHNLGPPLLAKSGQSPPSGQPSALEALCRLMLPEFVLLDPSAPNVPEWHVVERSCRPLAVLIGHTSLPCHAGWVRDKLLMRGDWAEEAQQRQTSQVHKLELRVQNLDDAVAQVSSQAAGLAQAVQAFRMSSASGGTGGSGTEAAALGAQAVLLETLRGDLEREASQRESLAAELRSQLRDVFAQLAQARGKREPDGFRDFAAASPALHQQEARLVALEGPAMGALREETESLREQLRKVARECAQRCEQAEGACNERAAAVQEAAAAAARELWEAHQGVIGECKASMASLKDILDAKDRLGEQLEALKQQQRQEDRSEILVRLQQAHDALVGRIDKVEAAAVSEQAARASGQQQADGYMRRLGQALEAAQAGWIKETGELGAELKELRRLASGDQARGSERQLAQALAGPQRRAEEAEAKAALAAALSAEESVARLARAQ